jgi:diguanylate cyclase (GGDEF)-like protein
MSDRRTGAGVKPARERKTATRRAGPSGPSAESLMEAALAVSQRLELDSQLHALLDLARTWSGSTEGIAFGPDAEGPDLAVVAGTLSDTDARLEILKRAIRARGPSSWAQGAFPLEVDGLHALALPLRGEADAAVAAVVLLDPREDAADALTELADKTRPAIANALRVRAIRELTIRDDTASCYNRRYFEEFIVEELARANRFKTPMSLIFFDMDNLKEVNTRLGHAAGSRTLLEVSGRVRGKIRKFDKLFRFGGDEFCIVLPETEWHGATEVAERVREAIATKAFLSHVKDIPAGPKMTASFGIASFPLHARTKEELVQRADRAMQSIKFTTKNGIAIAERRRETDGA